jgi:hypothetical protein
MSVTSPDAALADQLTLLVANTPGVTRLYAPTRVVPVPGTAQRVLADLGAPVPAAQVQVNASASKVTASIGIDLSAPAGDIGADVCSRIKQCLASAGLEMDVKITIAYVTN